VKKGYSVTYGARNLRRLIQKEIEDAIAAQLIARRGQGVETIRLSAENDKVSIHLGEEASEAFETPCL
jgi:ATP-dependent Clp protease ATP-binding subunit ClpA